MYKEKIKAIMEANRDDQEMLEFIESRVNRLIDYVQYVAFMETRTQRLSIDGTDGEAWRDAVGAMDSRRRDKHEAAMAAASQLNRLAAASGLQPFYGGTIDHAHRAEVGDMCQAVVDEYFAGRHARPLEPQEF